MVSIGRRPPSYDDPLAVLRAHHQNARRAVQALIAALATGGEVMAALDEAVAFFTGPLARHHEDEELSLFPRLPRAPIFDELGTEHRAEEAIVLALETVARRLRPDPALHDQVKDELTAHATALDATLAAHHAREEAEVFPAAEALPPAELRAIGLEMRIRRGGHEPR